MSRSGDQYLLEFAATGKYFAEWICADTNQEVLAKAINGAIDAYEKQRTDRVYACGVPVFSPSEPLSTVADENAGEPVSTQMQSSMVSTVTEKMASAVATATNTVLNYGRLFCATVTDKVLSNSADKFKEKFPKIDAGNAKLAFMYIGQLSNGWKPENHHEIGRASLSTLILVAVFDTFVNSFVPDELNGLTQKEVPRDADSAVFVDVGWKSTVNGDVDPGLPRLGSFLTCYRSKEGINPSVVPEQAKQIFLAFAATKPAVELSAALVTYLARPQQLNQSAVCR